MLLGAGASAEAHVPMANQFVVRIEQHLAQLPHPSNDAAIHEFRKVVDLLRTGSLGEPGLEAVFETIDDALDARFGAGSVPSALPPLALSSASTTKSSG